MNLDIVSGLITPKKCKEKVSMKVLGILQKIRQTNWLVKLKHLKTYSVQNLLKRRPISFSFIGQGTFVYKEQKEIALLEGADFQNALFGIWLGNKPADKNLKKALWSGEEIIYVIGICLITIHILIHKVKSGLH